MSSALINLAVTPAASGAAAYLITKYGLGIGGSLNVPFYGSLSTPMAMGAMVGASAFVGELGTSYVLPVLNKTIFSGQTSARVSMMERYLVPPALTGLSTGALVYLNTDFFSDISAPCAAAVGAGSYLVGNYASGFIKGSLVKF